MGSPKSFKDLFKNKKQVPFHHRDKIVLTPPPPKISEKEVKDRENKKRELTDYCNKLRCVVCGSQLDGPVNYQFAELYCVMSNSHFKVKYLYGERNPEYSAAIYDFAQEKPEAYQVIFWKKGDSYSNEIFKLDLDLIERFRFKEKIKVFSFIGKPITFPRGLSHNEFIKKMKLYTVFS